jgi:hypothetical protein
MCELPSPIYDVHIETGSKRVEQITELGRGILIRNEPCSEKMSATSGMKVQFPPVVEISD